MEKIINNTELIRIFERQIISDNIKSILNDFDTNYKKVTYKKGIYIWFSWFRKDHVHNEPIERNEL